jgi:hypothetical protein
MITELTFQEGIRFMDLNCVLGLYPDRHVVFKVNGTTKTLRLKNNKNVLSEI